MDRKKSQELHKYQDGDVCDDSFEKLITNKQGYIEISLENLEELRKQMSKIRTSNRAKGKLK